VLQAAEEAAAETVAVAVAGYQDVSPYQRALFNLFSSFLISFGSARGIAELRERESSCLAGHAVGAESDPHLRIDFGQGAAELFLGGLEGQVADKDS